MKILNTNVIHNDTIKIVVAGEAGNGKTTLASTIEKGLNEKVLVISAEAGLLSLRGSNVDYIELQIDENGKEVPKEKRIERLGDIFKWLKEESQMKKYKWIFVDSLSEIQSLLLDYLESLEEFQGPKNTLKKFGELSSKMMSLCKLFRDLPSYNVVFSALVKTETDSDNLSKMKISLIGAFADRLPALFDLVLYLGVTEEKDQSGKSVRKLLTGKTNKIDFPKDRSGKLDMLEPADLSVIVKKIRAEPLIANISEKAKQAHADNKVKSNG